MLSSRFSRVVCVAGMAAAFAAAVLVAFLVVMLAPRVAHAAEFTVTNTNNTGDGSLRNAINAANAATGADTITFSIPDGPAPGLEVKTISPTSLLPTIIDTVTIDGYTQPGAEPNDAITNANSAVLKIQLSGANAPSNAFGLAVSGSGAAGTTIKGLVINRFADDGLFINAPDTVIEGNFIGTNAAGTSDLGNGSDGVTLLSSGNLVGGQANAAQNLISGNDANGVAVKQAGATDNTISNNHIGTDADAGEDLGNSQSGVFVEDAPGVIVGGSSTDGTLNIISGNDEHGVEIIGADASGTRVLGNLIGLNLNGNGFSEIGNAFDGVFVSSTPQVEIGGTQAGQGNTISDNGEYGVEIAGTSSTNSKVLGNRIGTNRNGSSAFGNAFSGVFILSGSDNNTVGGTEAGAANVISGNGLHGVQISQSPTGTKVLGNLIGTDANGTASIGNSFNGVVIGGSGNTVGGSQTGAGNVISGNDRDGVQIASPTATENQVQGNLIGTNKDGTADLGNRGHGVIINAGPDNNLVGGAQAGTRNVISGNDANGVLLFDNSSTENITANRVLGNFIGTDVNGTASLGNFSDGVHLEGNVSKNEVAGNTISGNGSGVEIFGAGATGNEVLGNFIGTNASGASDLGNSGFGMFINAPGNFIGKASGDGNTFAFNGQEGVVIAGGAATGNRILFNSIFSNGGLGIDLIGGTESTAGATANDPRDPDDGPNNLQNKPVIDSATTAGGETTIEGRLNSTPNRTFTIQFFSNPSGNEGKTFIRERSVSTNARGNTGTFTVTLASPVAVGERITATATGPGGNTSEFSAPRTVTAP